MADETDPRIITPMPRALLEAIEAWRKQQDVIPSRAAAIRRLIEKGLQSDPPKA